MSEPQHHASDAMLAAYAAGALPYPFAVLVAAHVTLCDECRARLDSHSLLGGLVLEGLDPSGVGDTLLRRTLGALDDPAPLAPPQRTVDIYPAPLAYLLDGRAPRWQSLGVGAKQAMLWRGAEGSVRLLSIPAGQAVPDHGHRGTELTLVLSGSFSDEGGQFNVGDMETADETVEHVPTAGAGEPCICAAATDAPLRFRALLPRLFQPLLRI